jgi:hypothetical protein
VACWRWREIQRQDSPCDLETAESAAGKWHAGRPPPGWGWGKYLPCPLGHGIQRPPPSELDAWMPAPVEENLKHGSHKWAFPSTPGRGSCSLRPDGSQFVPVAGRSTHAHLPHIIVTSTSSPLATSACPLHKRGGGIAIRNNGGHPGVGKS